MSGTFEELEDSRERRRRGCRHRRNVFEWSAWRGAVTLSSDRRRECHVGLSCRIRRVCTGCPRCRSGAPRAGMATGHRVPSQLIGAAPPLCDYPPCRGHKGCSLPTARRTRSIGPNDNGSWVLTSSWALGSVPRRERHLRSKDLPAWPVLTLNPGSSVRVYPRGPTHTLRASLFS